MEGKTTLNDLPEELLYFLFRYLDVKDILELSKVCKYFYRFCQDDTVWRNTFPNFGQHLVGLADDLLQMEECSPFCRPVWKYLAIKGQCAYDCGVSGILDITPKQSATRIRGRYSEMLFAKYGESEQDAVVPEISNGCTVECWIQTKAPAAREMVAGVIIGSQSESMARNIWPHYHWQVLHIGPDGRIRGSILTYCLMKGPFVADGKWHHVAVSGDYSGQKLYVDGHVVDSCDKPFGSQHHQRELRYCQVGTGCISYGYNTPYDKDAMPTGHCGRLPYKGKIRDLRIWDMCLPESMVYQNYKIPRIDLYLKTIPGHYLKNLIYYWPLSQLLHSEEKLTSSLGRKQDYILKALDRKSLDKEDLKPALES